MDVDKPQETKQTDVGRKRPFQILGVILAVIMLVGVGIYGVLDSFSPTPTILPTTASLKKSSSVLVPSAVCLPLSFSVKEGRFKQFFTTLSSYKLATMFAVVFVLVLVSLAIILPMVLANQNEVVHGDIEKHNETEIGTISEETEENNNIPFWTITGTVIFVIVVLSVAGIGYSVHKKNAKLKIARETERIIREVEEKFSVSLSNPSKPADQSFDEFRQNLMATAKTMADTKAKIEAERLAEEQKRKEEEKLERQRLDKERQDKLRKEREEEEAKSRQEFEQDMVKVKEEQIQIQEANRMLSEKERKCLMDSQKALEFRATYSKLHLIRINTPQFIADLLNRMKLNSKPSLALSKLLNSISTDYSIFELPQTARLREIIIKKAKAMDDKTRSSIVDYFNGIGCFKKSFENINHYL